MKAGKSEGPKNNESASLDELGVVGGKGGETKGRNNCGGHPDDGR